ncbi:stage II sporulation protein M [Erythrobacter sp. SDW2]|uniref:stage II sporulation protein M n=1 Tax=Erythrobacter sp. SDW2 TaxID=2907154 RepID=UPI001F3A54F0|nr:stage II sporulation protein M [Erythrobacter sp. SDW2]UIP06777.1 stage II sporulation protein M [Erythrobacter sp. SDW2]
MRGPGILGLFGNKDVAAPPDIEAAALRSDRFRLEREGDWRRLEAIVTRLEKGRLRSIADADIAELPALYRTAASSLAVARETSLDKATLTYLEGLVLRAWYQVYGPRRGFIAWLRQFLTGGWARAVREVWLDICIALAAMIAGTVAGWVLVARNQDWYYALVPVQMGGVRAPGASREALAETLKIESETGGLSQFAAYLFYNNASVSILVFALGFAFGVPSLMLLVHNMALLGAMLWLYNSVGLMPDFLAWLAVHGTTELSAILLAGAAGLHVGRHMAFPGRRSILQATATAGRRAGVVMVGVVIMLIFAAVLEAFPRQLAGSQMRTIIGVAMAFVWLFYFSLSGRDWRRKEAA